MKKLVSLLLTAVMLATILPLGAVSALAANVYYINGVAVRYNDYESAPSDCWNYANNVYKKIWGVNFSNSFDESSNMLRNLSDSEITLTLDHLKTYVSNAALGSCLRICNSEYLHGSDGWGHSQIIVQKDDYGFTVFEGGLSASPYNREKYYTWSEYISTSWLGGQYAYIKYIKWPNAPAYSTTPDHADAPSMRWWVSDTPFGGFNYDLALESTRYICYELYDEVTGNNWDNVSSNDYTVNMRVFDPNGILITDYTVYSLDSDWINFAPLSYGTYRIEVTLDGDFSYFDYYEICLEPEIPENQFWVTHYNDLYSEGAGVIFTEQYSAYAWGLHVAFEYYGVAEEYGGYEAYRIVDISNGLADGSATPLYVPENGFVWVANYGNNYILNGTGDTDYTSPACNTAIESALEWSIGDKFFFHNIDFANIPTTTPEYTWYDDRYVCTATYEPFYGTLESSVYFVANGGSSAPATLTKNHGESITIPYEVPVRFGYTFKGWGTSSTDQTPNYMPGDTYTEDQSTALYAIWEYNEVTTTTFVKPCVSIVCPDMYGYVAFTPTVSTSYLFKGLEENDTVCTLYDNEGNLLDYSDDSNTNQFEIKHYLLAGNTYYLLVEFYDAYTTGDINLSISRGFEILYNLNGADGYIVPTYAYSGLNNSITDIIPSCAGFTFTGWKNYKTGVVYTSDDSFFGTDDMVLYAQWTFESTYNYSFSIDDENGFMDGEDVTLITDTSCYSTCNPYWATSIILKPTENYMEFVVVDVIEGCGFVPDISEYSDMWILVVHSSNDGAPPQNQYDADSYTNWMSKCVATKLSKGDTIVFYLYDPMTGTVGYPINDDSSEDPSEDPSEDNNDIGDVDGNGEIDQFDYLVVKRAYFNTYTLSTDERKRADVNRDNSVDQFDYVLIKRVYFGTYTIE